MVALPKSGAQTLAVRDSCYGDSRIFTIDAGRKPALIADSMLIHGSRSTYDPEDIAIAPGGKYWIASEGNATDSRPNPLNHADSNGNVLADIGLPCEIVVFRRASMRRRT